LAETGNAEQHNKNANIDINLPKDSLTIDLGLEQAAERLPVHAHEIRKLRRNCGPVSLLNQLEERQEDDGGDAECPKRSQKKLNERTKRSAKTFAPGWAKIAGENECAQSQCRKPENLRMS
jgi:hypothetical protein